MPFACPERLVDAEEALLVALLLTLRRLGSLPECFSLLLRWSRSCRVTHSGSCRACGQ